uniref:Uncharacterized protein n=1 Tax=Panagrolaimus davidi TaxID=227884 RepID=A0A914PZZ8_9BILA
MSLSHPSDSLHCSFSEDTYTLGQLKEMKILNEKEVHLILQNPFLEGDPFLVLNFETQNTYDRQEEIRQGLLANQGNQLSPTLIQFDTWDLLYSARDAMRDTHPWCFYSPRGLTANLVPTVTTTTINTLSETTEWYKICKIFQFFEI